MASEVPETLRVASKLHEHINDFVLSMGYPSVMISSSDPKSSIVRITVAQWDGRLDIALTAEMLRLGYALFKLEGSTVSFRKIKANVKLDTTERGHLVVKDTMFYFEP